MDPAGPLVLPSHEVPRPAARRAAVRLLPPLLSILIVCAVMAGVIELAHRTATTPPGVTPRPVYDQVVDRTPVTITVTENWVKRTVETTADDLRLDQNLWERMFFDDWDTVPDPLREEGLDRMLERYSSVLAGPEHWSHLETHDWDVVPQPLRAIAFVRIAQHWAAHYLPGARYGLSPRLVADTIAALMMVESWFEHRGVYINPGGDSDVGLGGASEYCRTQLRKLHARGRVDVAPADEEYYNPWLAARAMTVWFALMIDEAKGDLPLAVRAYHRGISAARGGAGEEYQINVERKRRRFIRNQGSPPSWRYLWRRVGPALPLPEVLRELPGRQRRIRPHLAPVTPQPPMPCVRDCPPDPFVPLVVVPTPVLVP